MTLTKINSIVDHIATAIPYFSEVGFAGYRRVMDGRFVTYLNDRPVNLNDRVCYLRYDSDRQYKSINRKSCSSIQEAVTIKIVAQLDCVDQDELLKKFIYELSTLAKKDEMTILSASTDTRAIFIEETGEQYNGNNNTLISILAEVRSIFDTCQEYELCSDCC